MAPQAQGSERPRRWSGLLRGLLSPGSRTWTLTVPLHLLAFVLLYVATARIIEGELLGLASAAAADRLEQVARQLDEVALAHTGEAGSGHVFDSLVATQWEINLQLLLPDGSFLGPPTSLTEEERVKTAHFFRDGAEQQVWLSSRGPSKLVRGLRRIPAGDRCLPCHRSGETLAVAAMSLDLTGMLDRVGGHSRRNLAILIVTWAALLGAINVVVRRSVERSAQRLEEQLAAAEAGEPGSTERSPDLVLDPGAAKLHRSLLDFLERQRRSRQEVASRLARSDQLASLGQLAAGLAHEIKNPLAGIQGAIELLREDTEEQRTARLYDDILGELKRVNEILQLLLESARPSPPRLAPVDPRTLLEETVQLLRPGFARRQIALRCESPSALGPVEMDEAKIRQVLINLIQNAAEAMDGRGNIVVRAGRFPDREGGLILAVEDDGPGIPPATQEKIFEPFFTTKFSGTGLGLAIARRLVEQHGGSLELDSEPGRGATFYVLLPSSAPPPADPGAGAAAAGGSDGADLAG